MTTSVPPVSTKGFQNAASYDQYRPSYPVDAVDSLLKHLQVHGLRGARIVDLAAGTGKFTGLLASRDEDYDIIAVEPHNDMRGELQKKLFKRVKVLEGEAESLESIGSQSADAVIASQSFHWFANTAALAEIYRILTPGGTFGMIWNVEDYNSPKSWVPTTEWERKLRDITWSCGNDDARFRHEQWRQVFTKQLRSNPISIQAADPLFSLPLGEESVKWTHWLDREAIWERYHTLSQFAVLDGEELAETKQKVLEVTSASDVERNELGQLALHGQTFFAWTTAIPGAPLEDGS